MRTISSQPLERDVLLRVSKQVGGSSLEREVATFLALPTLQAPVVVVLGLVKRGKSTLVNQVLNKKLSPTGRLPETASLIAYRRSYKRLAFALTMDHKRRSIKRTAKGFRRAVSRKKAKNLLVASYEGPVRLAEGITLVDTAGAAESIGSALSLGVSGAAEAVLTHADAAIMVIGSPPGVSGPELQYLRHVLRTVGTGRVQVVIKSLSSEVGRGDLVELQGYLEEMPDLANCAQNAILVADSDTASRDTVRDWINKQTKSTRYRSTSVEAKASSAVLEQVRALDSSVQIDISDGELSVLRPELAAEIRKFTAQSRCDAENSRLKAIYEAELASYRKNYQSWSAERDSVSQAFAKQQQELAKIRTDLRLLKNDSRQGSAGIGCLFLILFPFSFLAFPFGPFAALALFLINLGARSDRLKEMEGTLKDTENPVVAQIQNLKRQLQLLDERRPVEPTKPEYRRLREKKTKRSRRSKRLLQRLIMMTSSVALASVGLWFLLAATLPWEIPSRDSLEISTNVAKSTVPLSTPLINLRGLVIGTRSSGLSGDETRLIQQLLATECCPDVVADGVWGQQTEEAVDELRRKMKLDPGLGVDSQLWATLLRRPARSYPSSELLPMAVDDIQIPKDLVMIRDSSSSDGTLIQSFLHPYTSSGATVRWLRELGVQLPTSEWARCDSDWFSHGYRVTWVSVDNRVLSIWAGVSVEGRDELHFRLRSNSSGEVPC